MLVRMLQCTGHPPSRPRHPKELSGPNVNSANVEKPWVIVMDTKTMAQLYRSPRVWLDLVTILRPFRRMDIQDYISSDL